MWDESEDFINFYGSIADEAALANMEAELKEINNSGVPKHFHSKF